MSEVLTMFHKWVLQHDVDVFVQEQKSHSRGGETFHFKGYSCFYGGIKGQYSGVTLIKNCLNPTWVIDHHIGTAVMKRRAEVNRPKRLLPIASQKAQGNLGLSIETIS